MKITPEAVKERIAALESAGELSLKEQFYLEALRLLVAGMDSEPVAEVYQPQNAGICAPLGPSIRMLCPLEPGTNLYRHAQPVTKHPEVLPCSVLLEPGLRFGKGIKTSTMLAALARRAVYESDMAALSPEERAEFQAGIEDFKALIAQPAPVIPDGSTDMLRRWLAFGRGMQNAGSQLPRNLISETESMLATATQPQNAPQNIPEIIPDSCTWHCEEDINNWHSDCGYQFQFMEDGPEENGVKFCPNCGKSVAVSATEGTEE